MAEAENSSIKNLKRVYSVQHKIYQILRIPGDDARTRQGVFLSVQERTYHPKAGGFLSCVNFQAASPPDNSVKNRQPDFVL
jgi:hypothetical protein